MEKLFKEHLNLRLNQIESLLKDSGLDSIIIESGFPTFYFMDDQTTFFKSNPHFLFFCPDLGEGHILKITPGNKPELYYYSPSDFWHETSKLEQNFWQSQFNITVFDDYEKVWSVLKAPLQKVGVISPHPDLAIEHGCVEADAAIISHIHWLRISKTSYEIECVNLANKKASLGHMAAQKAFFSNKTEFETLCDYLLASEQKEVELPYGNIIAFNEKAAVLHYQNVRKIGDGHSFLIDAGARHNGYCSDITRTYCKKGSHPVFVELIEQVEKAQKNLCQLVHPNFDYQEIQKEAHRKITAILCDLNIIKASQDEALSLQISHTFFPHGVGHALGLQVHDVGGKQINAQGDPASPAKDYPYLRTLREIQENDILTIEPGIYFIPMLLEELKKDSNKKNLINWSLVEELVPFGGIRIEDNVVAKKEGPFNITRQYLPH